MATICLQDSGLIFRALDAKVHIMLVWLIYRLTWAAAIEFQIRQTTNKFIERNNLTGCAFIFWPPFKMIHWVMWPLKLIQLYLISPIEAWRRTLDLFFSLGVFLLQKWRDCLEHMLPGVTDWNPGLFIFMDPLSIEKASPLKLSVRLLSFQYIMCFPLLCGAQITFSHQFIPQLLHDKQQPKTNTKYSCYKVAFCCVL